MCAQQLQVRGNRRRVTGAANTAARTTPPRKTGKTMTASMDIGKVMITTRTAPTKAAMAVAITPRANSAGVSSTLRRCKLASRGRLCLFGRLSQPTQNIAIGKLSIMVRMLVADDAAKLLRTVILQRGLARKVGNADHPAEPGFDAELPGGDDPVRPIERAGHDLDSGAVDAAEAQRRAAGG